MLADVEPRQAVDAFLSRMGAPGTFCVAVSGGSDSTALLYLVHQWLQARGKQQLVAITIDHGLRAASDAEAQMVAAFCRTRNIRHIIKRWTGKKSGTGLQEAARLARYELLREAALSVNSNAVLTAHTRDDQLETIRMRQQRGMGRGLSGMAGAVLFMRDCWILRPFLDVRRTTLQQILTRDGIAWSDDPSNSDRRFERVRIRLEGGDPGADIGPLSMVERMTAARREESDRLARFLREHAIIHGDMMAELPQVPESLSNVLQQAVALLAALMGGRAFLPGSRSQDHIARFVSGSGPPRINLSRSVLDRRAQSIFIYRERRAVPVMDIAAGQDAVWDGRYRFVNGYKRRSVRIGPLGDQDHFPGEPLPQHVPRGAIKRAARSQPALFVAADGDDKIERQPVMRASGLKSARYFTHFDLFLPDFERKVANECASLFGLLPYPEPPTRSSG
ncbi:MAG: tRNA lysidine(34) synthetase TilS [Pseudomonadota bacterium]